MPDEGWLAPLLGYFDDPLVAAVAPRIVPVAGRPPPRPSPATRRPAHRSTWGRPRTGAPHEPDPLRPERRHRGPPGGAPANELFDPAPARRRGRRPGLAAGRGRMGCPLRAQRSTVPHEGPASAGRGCGRHAFYGTTAGPLARRHPGGAGARCSTSAWSAAVWALTLARRTVLALGHLAVSVLILARRLHGLVDQPVEVAATIAGGGTVGPPPALARPDPGLVSRLGARACSCPGPVGPPPWPCSSPALHDWVDATGRPRSRPLRRAPCRRRRRLRHGRLGRVSQGTDDATLAAARRPALPGRGRVRGHCARNSVTPRPRPTVAPGRGQLVSALGAAHRAAATRRARPTPSRTGPAVPTRGRT